MSSADPREDAPSGTGGETRATDAAGGGESRVGDAPGGAGGGETPQGDAPGGAGGGETPQGDAPGGAGGGETPRGDGTHVAPAGDPRAEPDAMTRGYARSRAKTEAIQAQLEPLGPDERPLGVKLATALALFVAAANLVGAALGAGGESPVTGVGFAALMVVVAGGLWTKRYLVLLLFQALLALSIIVSTLSLAFANNVLAVVLALAVIGASAPVFWLLIRVMARLQVPSE